MHFSGSTNMNLFIAKISPKLNPLDSQQKSGWKDEPYFVCRSVDRKDLG